MSILLKAARNRITQFHGCTMIELSNGENAIVNEADYYKVWNNQWTVDKRDIVTYAWRNIKTIIRGTRKRLQKKRYMHHEILPQKDGWVVDHINGNGLDNRRCNLRYLTQKENLQRGMLREAERNTKIRQGFLTVHSCPWCLRQVRLAPNITDESFLLTKVS